MPLFYNSDENDFRLAVWKMDEGLDELLYKAALSEKDLAVVNAFTHVPRKKEWICIRLLLRELNRNFPIAYHPSGKPFLENSAAHISISHTRDFAGIIISDSRPAGLDLERIHHRIEKIAHKFVSPSEEKFLTGVNRLEKLFVVWGVKEVLFKMHGVGELVFKEHLSVHPFEFSSKGSASATVSKNDFRKNYNLDYLLVSDLLITYCVSS